MDKLLILNEFKKLQDQIMYDIDNTSGKIRLLNQYRLRSIGIAMKTLEKYNKKIIEKSDIDELIKLKGIGEGTIRRIKELIDTGKLAEIKITKGDEQYLKMIDQLEEIYGIGRATAYKLFKEYKIKSIDELIKKVGSGEITVSENIKIGLKYVNRLDTNIPRGDIDEIKDYLLDILLDIDPRLFGAVCGSYRRLKEVSGDIDLVIIHSDYKKINQSMRINYLDVIVNRLIEKKFIIESLTRTSVKTKYMGIFEWKNSKPRRIDIRLVPYESYYFAILYFTGSKDFNKNMRLNAIAQNYTLNEYGIFDHGHKHNNTIKVKSEKEIFDILGMEYVTPDKR